MSSSFSSGGGIAQGDDPAGDDNGTPPAPPTLSPRTAFRRFWPMTKGLRSRLVGVWLCTVLGALAETAAILLFGDLTDNALQNAAQWLGIAVVGAAVGYAGGSLAVRVSERFVMRLREHVFDHVRKLPPRFFQRHRQGDLLSRLTGDVEAIEQIAVSGLIGTASAMFSAVVYAAAAFWLRWELAAATFVLAPSSGWPPGGSPPVSGPSHARAGVADGTVTSVVEESLGNLVLTQAYGRQDAERRRLSREATAWFRAAVRSGGRLRVGGVLRCRARCRWREGGFFCGDVAGSRSPDVMVVGR